MDATPKSDAPFPLRDPASGLTVDVRDRSSHPILVDDGRTAYGITLAEADFLLRTLPVAVAAARTRAKENRP